MHRPLEWAIVEFSDNDDDCTEGYPNKRAKYSEEETTLAHLIDNSQGNYADQMRTDEQMKIL